LACGAEAVGALNRQGQAKEVRSRVETGERVEGNPSRTGVDVLKPQPRGDVANQVMPASASPARKGYSQVTILVTLEGVIRNAKKLDLVRLTQGCSSVASREAQLGRGVQRQPQIGDVCRIMKGVVGNAVAGVETRKLAQIIQ